MTKQIQGASAPYSFDAAQWLAALTAIGGGYALMADRRLAFVTADCPSDDLARVMAEIVNDVDRQEAIKTVIERHQPGEELQ